MCLSEPQTAVAMTLMRTSAWPGVGTGTVLISVAEGAGAGLVLTTAVMVFGSAGAPLADRPFFLVFDLAAVFAINQPPDIGQYYEWYYHAYAWYKHAYGYPLSTAVLAGQGRSIPSA